MKTNLKDKTVLCRDNGLFFDLCLKLADYFGKVYYHVPWQDAFPGAVRAMIGTEWKDGKRLDSFDGKPFERIENYFDYVDEADLCFFPDVGDGDLQAFLESKGKLVFGSRKGEELELERWDTKQYFKKIGMDVQPIRRFIGIDALEEYLKKTTNKWVKISKFRKNFETFHHINYQLTEPVLQKIEWRMGPIARIAEFIVEDHIDAIAEEGFDGYCIDGKFPSCTFAGNEVKERGLAGMFFEYPELSKGIRMVNRQMESTLKNYGYRGFISSEVRTTTDGKHYAIDPCARCPSPPNELYQEIYANLGDIIWEGSQGNLIDPVPKAKYGLEVMISSDWNIENHQAIYFPAEMRQWVKLKYPIKIDGQYYCMNEGNSPGIGALVAIGDSFDECRKKIEVMAPKVEGHGIEVDVECIDEAIDEFYKSNPKLKK
jgi:hypothetical protein